MTDHEYREVARAVVDAAKALEASTNVAHDAGLIVDIEIERIDVTTLADEHRRERFNIVAVVSQIL